MSPLHEKHRLNNFRLLDNISTVRDVAALHANKTLALTEQKCKTLTDGISAVSQPKPKQNTPLLAVIMLNSYLPTGSVSDFP